MKKIKISSNKSFGIIFFIVFFLIGIYPLVNNEGLRIWSLVVSLVFLILGLRNSRVLTPFNILWFKFGLFLGKIISPFVMSLVFFLVVTPTGIIMRLLGKDLLNLKKNNSKTYWITRNSYKSNMKKQF
tara:strand:+ start:406 stop:789 length:384 start_codon:yes stop_codon:yes gene_type:complete